MAVPGPKDSGSTNADADPLGRDGTGSVVGIQFEVAGMHTGTMYTGTMISDLMAAVERAETRAEQKAEQQSIAEEWKLRAILALQIPVTQGDQVFVGAA